MAVHSQSDPQLTAVSDNLEVHTLRCEYPLLIPERQWSAIGAVGQPFCKFKSGRIQVWRRSLQQFRKFHMRSSSPLRHEMGSSFVEIIPTSEQVVDLPSIHRVTETHLIDGS